MQQNTLAVADALHDHLSESVVLSEDGAVTVVRKYPGINISIHVGA